MRQPLNKNGEMLCLKCGDPKPATTEYFPPSKVTKSGLVSECRVCKRKSAKEWKDKNRERITARRKELYHLQNKDRVKENERQRAIKRPLLYRAQALRTGMATRAKAFNLPFDSEILTNKYLMELIEKNPACPCCKKEIDYGYKFDNKKKNNCPSIDRIDNKKGYVIGNIALICWRCNNLKRDATADELQKIVDWMRSFS